MSNRMAVPAGRTLERREKGKGSWLTWKVTLVPVLDQMLSDSAGVVDLSEEMCVLLNACKVHRTHGKSSKAPDFLLCERVSKQYVMEQGMPRQVLIMSRVLLCK